MAGSGSERNRRSLQRRNANLERLCQIANLTRMYQRDHAMEAERPDWYVFDLPMALVRMLIHAIGVAHEAEQDDYYRGQLIPKGSRILPLDW